MDNLIRFRSPSKYWRDGECLIDKPVSSHVCAPSWYRELARMMDHPRVKNPTMTIKMCPPFQEALFQGYIIPAPFDFTVACGEDGELMQMLESGMKQDRQPLVEEVEPDLVEGGPWEGRIYRLRNYWRVETPPGYSCLMVTPLCRSSEDAPFEILPTVLHSDDDGWATVNVAFRRRFPIEVTRGTPMIQVIPFLREEWERQLSIWDAEKVQEIVDFREEYFSPKNRKYPEGADTSDPDQGWGAYHKLVKVPTRFR